MTETTQSSGRKTQRKQTIWKT